MGLPEPIEPRPEDSAPPPGGGRADWLCGAEEGLEAEIERTHGGSRERPAPKLFKPGADAPTELEPDAPPPRRDDSPPVRLVLPSSPDEPRPTPPPAAPRREPPPPPEAVEPPEFTTGPSMLWEPGANSVPVLPRSGDFAAPPPPPPTTAASAAAEPAASPLDFPMDDAEERARATAEAAEAASAAAERAARPHAVVTPDAFDVRDALVPWWMRLPQMLREDRRIQVALAVLLVAVLAVVFWPHAEKSLSIGAIRRDPGRFDGQDVRVSGRVGEVFDVGAGYAYYLHQGRDTLVVFTRSRTPRRGDHLTVVGMVSTGYLNGQSGTALFESPPGEK